MSPTFGDDDDGIVRSLGLQLRSGLRASDEREVERLRMVTAPRSIV